MQTCPACSVVNADEAAQCSNCHQLLGRQLAVLGPEAGSAAYPGAPEASYYNAREYQLSNQLDQNRAAPRLNPGATIGHQRYRIMRVVALGGMGAIYEAEDLHLHRPCAVKEMLDNFTELKEHEQAVEWFQREASMLHDLHHPAIPGVRDFFEEDRRYYLVMDYVQGRNLAQVLDQEGSQGLPELRVRNWAAQICDVLSYLHHQGIIFRDMKPANVMVGNDDHIKLIDFGIARNLRAQNEATVIVTYGFAAPEQLQGHPEPRSDIYSLGATLHRLLTHHDPANNKPLVFDFPPIRALRPDVTPAFEQIIMRALAPRPVDRWLTAGEMGRTIRNLPPLTAPPVVSAHLSMPLSAIARAQSSEMQASEEAILQARLSLESGRWQEALRAAKKAVATDRASSQAYKMLGIVHARSQPPDAPRALLAYQESLQISPNDSETHRLVGDVRLFLLRQPSEAMNDYQRATLLNPGDFEAFRLLGMCYEQTNQLETARQFYGEAVRLAPHYLPAHIAYGQLALRQDRLTDAERAFVSALRLNPGVLVARYLLAQVYERQGRLAEALREAEYATQVDPRDQTAQATLQRLRKAAKDQRRNTRMR